MPVRKAILVRMPTTLYAWLRAKAFYANSNMNAIAVAALERDKREDEHAAKK